jgi:hypothetical protein
LGCAATGKKTLLTADFQKDVTLRYKFVSSRDIDVETNPSETKPGKSNAQRYTETMETVVAYTPVEINPYGLTVIKALCETVKISRSKRPAAYVATPKDAVESLPGKTFSLTVSPSGKIKDYSELENLIHQTGEKAFRPNVDSGRIKEPDMISDFIASQWFLWDSISSVKNLSEGVATGQTWNSKLSVPTPMVMRKARDVTYTLAEIRRTEKGRLAVIQSSYTLAESVPKNWPIPYSGTFQMAGTFGFFRGYKVLDLKGRGEELFNIDAGRTEQYRQQYRMQLEASFPLAIGPTPRMTINQTLTMQLLEPQQQKDSEKKQK